MIPGTLTVFVDDRRLVIDVAGASSHVVDVGPLTLMRAVLGECDPPEAADLTNALGLVHDHLDDVIIEAPAIAATPGVILTGPYAVAMARVEIGDDEVPDDYQLRRADADEVFRTLAVESIDERRHNPGLPADHAESIIATCCVILALLRRLELRSARVDARPITALGREGR